MTQPFERSSDDLYDNSVTGARARGAGRLLGDPDDGTTIAEEGDDADDDLALSAEETAMHLTRAPEYRRSDESLTD